MSYAVMLTLLDITFFKSRHSKSCTQLIFLLSVPFSGYIQVGFGGDYGKHVFMEWDNPEGHTIRSVGLSTGYGHAGEWEVLELAGMGG